MDLILSWLNDEVQLSQKVTNIEEQFANGYLLGELLSRYNQQFNFLVDFVNRNTKQHVISNFKLLQPTMKCLRVRFDSNIAKSIIRKEKGVALRVLHQLKNALDKVNSQLDIKVYKRTGKLNSTNPLKKIPNVKEQYDKVESKLFSDRLNRILPPQTQVNLEKHLQKFEDVKVEDDKQIARDIKAEEESEIKRMELRRNGELDKIRRLINFANDWKEQGEQNWRENMKVKMERERKDKAFRIMQTKKKKTKKVKRIDDERKDMITEIDKFERKYLMERETDAETATEDENMRDIIKKKFSIENNIKRPGLAQMIKTRERELHSEYSRKERDKRRRKMIVDQSKAQKEIEIKRKEKMVLDKLIQESRQEEEIRYEMWRAKKCKEIIMENRNLRDHQYNMKEHEISNREENREFDLLEKLNADLNKTVGTYLKRDNQLLIKEEVNNRDKNFKKCRQLVDILFEITESCYKHLQDKNIEEIDPRYWNENIQIFKGKSNPFVNRTSRHPRSVENYFKDYKEETTYKIFLSKELREYIKSTGQWNLEIPDEVKTENESTNLASVDTIKEELDIPKKPVNNNILCDLISDLIDRNFIEKRKKPELDYPGFLPLKVCLVGKTHTGKSSISRYLNNRYGLEIISIQRLVSHAINRFGDLDNSFEQPEDDENYVNSMNAMIGSSLVDDSKTVKEKKKELLKTSELKFSGSEPNLDEEEENNPEEKEDKKEEDETPEVKNEEEIEINDAGEDASVKNIEFNKLDESVQRIDSEEEADGGVEESQEILKTGEEVEERKKNPMKTLIRKIYKGEEPSDELYCKIIIQHLKSKFGLMSEEEYFKKNFERKQIEIEEIKAELRGTEIDENQFTVFNKIDEKTKRENEPEIDESKIKLIKPAGYVLIDFPNTYEQAVLLEKLMTGFTPKDKIQLTEAEEKKRVLRLLMDPSSKPPPRKELLNSGFDKVINIETKSSNSLERALGDLKVPGTDKDYHLILNPPPINQSPLVETLTLKQMPGRDPYLIADKNKHHLTSVKPMIEFYTNFGVEENKDIAFDILHGDQDISNVLADVADKMDKVIEYKNTYFERIGNREKELKEKEEEEKKAKEEFEKNEARMEILSQEVLTSKLKDWSLERVSDPMDEQLKISLYQIWEVNISKYVDSMNKSLKDIRDQRELVSSRVSEYKRSFIQFLERKDEKRDKVMKYQKMYNDFVDEYPDLLEKENAKEELHQRVDDLCNDLFNMALEKKKLATEERKRIMDTHFVELEMEIFTNFIIKIIRAEINRYITLTDLIRKYFRALEKKPLENVKAGGNLLNEEEEIPVEELNEKVYSYPKVEKVIMRAVDIIRKGEVKDMEESNKTVTKGRGKKEPKKRGRGAKDKKKEVQKVEEVEKKTELELKMEEAVKLEQLSTLHRIANLRQFSLKSLKGMREDNNQLSHQLQVCLEYAFEIENNALDELTMIFQNYIEKEKKIQTQIDMTNYDVILSHKILNFYTPPPVIRPAIESRVEGRFLISDLKRIKIYMENITDYNGYIAASDVFRFLNSLVHSEEGRHMLPKHWQNIGQEDLERMITSLDKKFEGKISMGRLFCLMALQSTPFPSDKKLNIYENNLSAMVKDNGDISMKDFIEMHAWFDEFENEKKEYKRSRTFDRLKHFKTLLYEAQRGNAKMMGVKMFMNTISCFGFDFEGIEVKDYFDALFPYVSRD